MGWQNSLFRVLIITAAGPGSGLFIYSGAPAAGNNPILAAVAPGTTTDPFGNPVSPILNIGSLQAAHAGFDAAGIEYLSDSSGNIRITIDPGRQFIGFYAAPGLFNGGALQASQATALGTDQAGNAYLPGFTSYSPLAGIFVANNISTANQVSWWTAPAVTGPWTQIASIAADINSDLVISTTNRLGVANPVRAVLAGVFETWHLMSLTAGWTAGNDVNGNNYPPSYRLNPDGSVSLRGTLVTPAAGSVTNVAFATLPASYVNTFSSPPTACICNALGGQVGVAAIKSTGSCFLFGGFNNASSIYLDSTLRVQ